MGTTSIPTMEQTSPQRFSERLQRMGGTENVRPNLAKVPKCPAEDSVESWTGSLSQLPNSLLLYKHFAERTEFEVDDGECTDGTHADIESLICG